MTQNEIAELTGLSKSSVRDRIARATRKGLVRCVGTKPIVRADGVCATAPAYVVVVGGGDE